MRERSNQEVTAHLEQQKHPCAAEADEGGPNKAGHPHQAELQDCNHKGLGSIGWQYQYTESENMTLEKGSKQSRGKSTTEDKRILRETESQLNAFLWYS